MVAIVSFGTLFANGSSEQGGNKTLTIWYEKSFNDDANYAMEKRVNDFAKEYDVKVKLEVINALDFMTKLNAAIESGNVPDIVTLNMYKVLSYGNNNPFLDMTDYVTSLDQERAFFDASSESTKIEGKNYFVPSYNALSLMFYRTDKLAEAGLDVPETWEEVFEAAKAISDPANGFYGLGMGCGPTDEDGCNTFRTILWSNGGSLYSKQGDIVCNTDPVALEVASAYKDAFDSGAVPPAAVTWGPSGNNASYLMGESGIVYNSPTLYNALKNDPNYAELFANTAVMAPPVGKSGESITLNLTHGWGILSASRNIDTAKQFLDYFYDKDWYDSYIEFVAPVFVPVFEDAYQDPFFTEDPVMLASIDYASNAKGYYGYPVEPLEGRVLASKHYYQFPVVAMLNNIVTKGMSPQEALDKLATDTENLKNSI